MLLTTIVILILLSSLFYLRASKRAERIQELETTINTLREDIKLAEAREQSLASALESATKARDVANGKYRAATKKLQELESSNQDVRDYLDRPVPDDIFRMFNDPSN